jgi:hypothetical protein
MKAFETNKEKIHWVKVKDGHLCYWDGTKELVFDEMQGIITDIFFKDDEYQGRNFTLAMFTMYFDAEKYILSLNTDSSYFRSFCNYLRSADLTKNIVIRPKITEDEGKKKYSIFLQQEGKWLKAYYTKLNPGDFPQLIVIETAGKKVYDNTQQIAFWKKWLIDTFGNKISESNSDDLPF